MHEDLRGYCLKGREFILKEQQPRKDEGVTLDGSKILDEYWVVSLEEYMRVVPEARGHNFDSDEIYIPLFVARPSFRPCYVNRTKV